MRSTQRKDLERIWPMDQEGTFCPAEAAMLIEGQESGR